MTMLSRALPAEHVQIGTDPWTEPFWTAAKERRLTAAQCADCGHFRMPPTPFCPQCQSQATLWPTLLGTGVIYSFAVCTKSPFPGLPDFVYIPIVVELDGAPGIRLVSNLINADPAGVAIGQRLTVDWHPVAEGFVLPVFRIQG